MPTRTHRKLWITMLAAGMILPGASCVSTDTASALADLAASTTGGLVEILVKNYLDSRLPGAHRDEYFYSTDPTLRADQIVSLSTGRWSIEVTFQEVRAHLGLTTPRNWSAKSVQRTAPCLLGLFSLVSLIFARHVGDKRFTPRGTGWYAKRKVTFSDAITVVRRLFWETVLKQSMAHTPVTKLPMR